MCQILLNLSDTVEVSVIEKTVSSNLFCHPKVSNKHQAMQINSVHHGHLIEAITQCTESWQQKYKGSCYFESQLAQTADMMN